MHEYGPQPDYGFWLCVGSGLSPTYGLVRSMKSYRWFMRQYFLINDFLPDMPSNRKIAAFSGIVVCLNP